MASSPYGLLSPVIGLFMDEMWKPIKKHCGYCLKPGRKVRKLATSTDGLRVHIDTISEQIQLGKRPRDRTTAWIESAQSIEVKSRTIISKFEGRTKHMLGCSWNCWFNYRIGYAARKRKKQVDELEETTPKKDDMFTLLPPVGRELPLPPNIVGQNEYMKKIVGCIKQGSSRLVGICAMGGAGKTTLLKQLNNTFSCTAEMHMFDHVVYVEIGQQRNLDDVRKDIACQLGVTVGQDEHTTSTSASLYKFLKERKFLLLMDNLWKPLDLGEVGIPQEQIGHQNRQMIVIATRDQHICRSMEADSEVFVLQKLEFEEAWSLFKVNAGSRRLTNTNSQIRVYAESIVHKCGGLPLALKIVGKAMASKEGEHDWELAVMLLQQSQFQEVLDAYANLYEVLYISYEHLPDTRTKQCFLSFALKPEDYAYVPFAIDHWMGHGLLDGDDDMRTSDLRGRAIVGCLKRACLLEEHASRQNYVRLHDTIKGLALWIVKNKQGDGASKNWLVCKGDETIKSEEWCTAHRISLGNLTNLIIPCSVPCHVLLTLIVIKSSIIGDVPKGFFTAAPSLTFLDLSETNLGELPSDVGELVNLQYLDLSATQIQSIPGELQLLKSLRYLYLGYTYNLVAIPGGTFSALTMLRVLDLYCSGSVTFPADTIQEHIRELDSLVWLQSLGFTVTDPNSLQMILNSPTPSKASLKRLCLDGVNSLSHLHIAPPLFTKTRVHEFEGLTLEAMENLKELSIGDTGMDSDWHFKKLEELRLSGLVKLEVVLWKGVVPHACFPKLCVLMINDCDNIRTVSWIKHLPCLEEVYLVDCKSMELVADAKGGGTMSSVADLFPRLKVLGLSGLKELSNICDGTLVFPCLQRLLVYKCDMLATLPSWLRKEERMPVLLGAQDWWDKLVWEDGNMKSTLAVKKFRELPSSFQGKILDVRSTLLPY